MGVKGLNSFLNALPANPGNSMISLSFFNDKTIVIDFSNLLYSFLYRSNINYLMELINFIHKFQRYNIKQIFVFDGKPNVEKQYIIEHRRAYRERLNRKIDELKEINGLIDNNYICKNNTDTIKNMTRKATVVKNEYIQECKKLFDILGILYIHIENLEADAIFKFLLDTKQADACFSGDSDLIAYGCHTVLKDLNYSTDMVQCIYINHILETLEITLEQFIYTCILSGTDYNNSLKRSRFEINLELVRKYGTIQGIIDNLEEINASQPEEYKKSFPTRFDWKMVYSIFMDKIPSIFQKIIIDSLNCQEYKTCLTSKAISSSRLQNYINNNIKPLDKGYKYIRKFVEIVRTKFNIELQF